MYSHTTSFRPLPELEVICFEINYSQYNPFCSPEKTKIFLQKKNVTRISRHYLCAYVFVYVYIYIYIYHLLRWLHICRQPAGVTGSRNISLLANWRIWRWRLSLFLDLFQSYTIFWAHKAEVSSIDDTLNKHILIDKKGVTCRYFIRLECFWSSMCFLIHQYIDKNGNQTQLLFNC